MRKLAIGMNANRGFTLIEILIVIVIISMTVGFALLAFGDFGKSKQVLYAANQLENTLKLAQQQAILESSTLGLRIDSQSYQILKYQTSAWLPVSSRSVFKMHYFPEKTEITVKTSLNHLDSQPAIIINPSGEFSPFTIALGTKEQGIIIMISGNAKRHLQITGPKRR